jgi:hypothetical protein
LTIAVSEQDRASAGQSGTWRARLSDSTGVDTSYFVPDGTAQLPARLVFTGVDGLASQRRRGAVFHRRHPAPHSI